MISSVNNTCEIKNDSPTVLSVAKDYAMQPAGFQKLVVAPSLKAFSWAKWYEYPLSGTSQTVHWIFQRLDHILDWEGFPKMVVDTLDSGFELADTAFLGAFGDLPTKIHNVYFNFLTALDLVADSVKIGEKEQLIALTDFHERILDCIGVLGSVALLIKSAEGLHKQVRLLSSLKVGDPQYNLAMIRAASKICLIALGCFGIAAFASVELAAKVVLLSISTLLLFLSLFAHFYEKIHCLDVEKSVAK